jgi:hypothetical protein
VFKVTTAGSSSSFPTGAWPEASPLKDGTYQTGEIILPFNFPDNPCNHQFQVTSGGGTAGGPNPPIWKNVYGYGGSCSDVTDWSNRQGWGHYMDRHGRACSRHDAPREYGVRQLQIRCVYRRSELTVNSIELLQRPALIYRCQSSWRIIQPVFCNSTFLSQCQNRMTKPGKSRRNCVARILELPR